jgi:C4-dicarboxylate-binding protein DctP
VNKKFWDKLPADIRVQLEAAMREATLYADKIALQENDASLEAVKKSGKTAVHVPTDAEKAEWQRALLPVQAKMASRIGKDLIDAVNKTVAAK